jgi:hypothetical protein
MSQPTFVPSTRSLKQPLPPAWVDAHKAALGETQKLRTAKERIQDIERLNQKSVTVVLYYKAHKLPLILVHAVDTWPHLQLSSIPSLIADLELTLESYLEHYSNGKWTLIRVSSPMVVTRDQRVLLRVRQRLTEEFNDAEWPGIDQEIEQQGKSRQAGTYLKRNAEDLVSPLKKVARDEKSTSASNSRPRSPSLVLKVAQDEELTFASNSRPRSPSLVLTTQPSSLPPSSPLATSVVSACGSRSSKLPAKSKPHKAPTQPKARLVVRAFPGAPTPPCWPDDFYVCDVHAGLREITRLMSQNGSQKGSFSTIFDGAPYRRTTVAKYKGLLDDENNRATRKEFIQYGRVQKALFLRFVEACTGKRPRRKGQRKPQTQRCVTPTSDEAESSDGESVAATTIEDKLCSEDDSDPDPDTELVAPIHSGVDELPDGTKPACEPSKKGLGELCKFCREPLPAVPTPHLNSLLLELKKLPGYPDRLSFVAYIDYCARHRFETDEVPKAIAAGWPDAIDFFGLVQRTRNFKAELEELLLDPQDSQFFQVAVQGLKGKGKNGIATFQKEGCGYYGELGFQIISMILQELFPPSSVDLSSVKPLSWYDTIERFLLPEVAVLLIMDDMDALWEDAVEILHESRLYGNMINPCDDDHPAVVAVRQQALKTVVDLTAGI